MKPFTETVRYGGVWMVPEDYTPDNVSQCRGCNAEILWCITPAGKKSPTNRDGTSHFSDCPARDQFRKPKQ